MSKLEETAVPLTLSSNVFDFCKASSIRQKVLVSKNFTKTNIESYLRSDSDNVDIKLPLEDTVSNRLNDLGNVKGIVKRVEQRQLERSKKSKEWFEREELKKIKLGINAERRRWRKGRNSGESVVDVATRRLALTNRYLARVVDNVSLLAFCFSSILHRLLLILCFDTRGHNHQCSDLGRSSSEIYPKRNHIIPY